MFNSRIYSKDDSVPFLNIELKSRSKNRYNKPPQINESNLDTDRLSVRGIKDDSRMNRAVFNMKPLSKHHISDSFDCSTRTSHKEDPSKEDYCYLHQKYARVRNMNDLIGSQQLDNQISQCNKMKLKNEFEKSIEGFYKSIDPRVSFIDNISDDSDSDSDDYHHHSKESFSQDFADTADQIYLLTIRSNIESILNILENVECFQSYSSYWKDLRRNLEKNRWNINILPINDNDIAYSLNKGQELNFKTKDSKCFLPMKIMIYVLCHELSHVACTNEKDHTETFSKIMWLIECAAFMANLLKPSQIPINNITFSEQSVVSRHIVIEELIIGFYELRKSNKNIDYIDATINYLKQLS